MYDPRTISNYFLLLANEDGVTITPMKLQKLVYFAHGYFLAVTDNPLINDEVQAWQFGPVIPSLYHHIKHYGRNPITGYLRSNLDTTQVLPESSVIRTFLRKIWEVYGGLSAIQLSKMTHEPDTPWAQTCKKHSGNGNIGWNIVIPDKLIKEHFDKQLSH